MRYLIFLHPLNHDSSIITPFKVFIEVLGFKLIAPDSPLGKKWFDIHEWEPRIEDDRILFNEDKIGIQKSRDFIENIIDKLVYKDVKPEDIYLIGFSQGGCLATYCGYTSKHKLKKVIGLCSYVPLINDKEEETTFRKDRDVSLINGVKDEIIKVEHVRLIKTRYPYVKINWIEDCGHEFSFELLMKLLKELEI